MEEQKSAGMPAQEYEDVQTGTDEYMNEQTGETVQENTDGSPQVIHRVSGKQRRASLEEYKAMFPPGTVHRRPEARVPQPRHTRCPRPHRQPVRQSQV